jgi:hypothetical protein
MCIGQFRNRTIGKEDFDNPDGYERIIPFDFKWRAKLGKAECDCKEVEEVYAPWYGTTWYHMPDCAIGKHLKKYPGIENLVEVRYPMIAQTE